MSFVMVTLGAVMSLNKLKLHIINLSIHSIAVHIYLIREIFLRQVYLGIRITLHCGSYYIRGEMVDMAMRENHGIRPLQIPAYIIGVTENLLPYGRSHG